MSLPPTDARIGDPGDPLNLPPLLDHPDETLSVAQDRWRSVLADNLYGPFPPAPDRITTTRSALSGENAERVSIELQVKDRSFLVDAALWLPQHIKPPYPLIAGLDFIGPAGILAGDAIPLDPCARIVPRPLLGAGDGRLNPLLRGTSSSQWPVSMLTSRGYAVLVSCYGSWVPDAPDQWEEHGLVPLLGARVGAAKSITLWAWSLQRLLGAAQGFPEIDPSRLIVAGHSRLGKSALWAAANDTRVSAVFAAHSGCAGAALARSRVGETPKQLVQKFPHWTAKGWADVDPCELPFDQHMLLAAIAPRTVYLATAEDDTWANPMGSLAALRAASEVWPSEGGNQKAWTETYYDTSERHHSNDTKLGFHLRAGGHDLIPYDWARFLLFLENSDAI